MHRHVPGWSTLGDQTGPVDIRGARPLHSGCCEAVLECASHAVDSRIFGSTTSHFTKKKKEVKIKPKVVIPSDIIALNELAILKDKELWENGKLKQYHSEISEILRTYLEERFRILALELPTYDILQNLKNRNLQKEDLIMLTTILQRADLAKYAKSKPTDSENNESMDLSVDFVKNTKAKEVRNG